MRREKGLHSFPLYYLLIASNVRVKVGKKEYVVVSLLSLDCFVEVGGHGVAGNHVVLSIIS